MDSKTFIDNLGINFFTGVPDSVLNSFCFELLADKNKTVKIGVNEGACLAMAAGHYVATKNVPCVFMQNSGLGNIVNPYTSLANEKVYGIPMLFVVGWRGEPGVKDEPQHAFMGEITDKLLETLEIEYKVIDKDTTIKELGDTMRIFREKFAEGKSCAFIIKKGALLGDAKGGNTSNYEIVREKAIEIIISKTGGEHLVVSSTGKISRELFEIRKKLGQSHSQDFLTVGSMGFASSIAFQIANELPERKIVCIDGDGAALMHLGAMATIGENIPKNFTHIILDNESHESVGGMPTDSKNVDWVGLAKSLGYKSAKVVLHYKDLEKHDLFDGGLLVVKTNKTSRGDLGRPTTTAKENIKNFMEEITNEKLAARTKKSKT